MPADTEITSQISASSSIYAVPIPQRTICDFLCSEPIQLLLGSPGFTLPGWHGHANADEPWSTDVRESLGRSKLFV